MRFRCAIDMDSAAFADETEVTYSIEDVPGSAIAAGLELGRILRRVADGCEAGIEIGEQHRLLDTNGNTVGKWWIADGPIASEAAEILREYTTCAICGGPIHPDDHKVVPWPNDGRSFDQADEIAHADCALNDA